MLNIKKLAAAIGAGALLAASFLPALAVTEAGVSATVTPKLIAVSVSDGQVAYGTLDLSPSAISPVTKSTEDLTDTQVVHNESNVTAKIDVKSSDTTGGTTPWNLVASGSIAADAYGHQYKINVGAYTDFPATNDYATNVVTLDKAGDPNDDANLNLKIFMPTASTDVSTQKSIAVTVRVHE